MLVSVGRQCSGRVSGRVDRGYQMGFGGGNIIVNRCERGRLKRQNRTSFPEECLPGSPVSSAAAGTSAVGSFWIVSNQPAG